MTTTPDAGLTPLLAHLLAVFEAYVARHRQGAARDVHNIDLKRDHSLHVLENCRRLALGLELPDAPARAALVAGLFHDFGRFPQYARFKTFHDGNSVNHARLGARAMREERALAGLPAATRRLATTAVMLHNRRFLPRGLDAATRCLTELVRDADKIDIIRIMAEHFANPDHSNPVVTLHVAEHPTAYTPAFLQGVLDGETGDYRAMRWTNDFKILLCGWVSQLAFVPARRLLAEQGRIFRLMDTLPRDEGTARLRAKVETELGEAGLAAMTSASPRCLGALRAWEEA